MPKIYIGGALANPEIVRITKLLMAQGYDVFSEWYCPGPEADVNWLNYQKELGFSYREAMKRPAAQFIFNFDKHHIDEADVFVMMMPCGKSAHLELGYAIGSGKVGIIYLPEEPDRADIMHNFATAIACGDEELLAVLKETSNA